ncbi:response regulator [Cohnella sp.]|uniref:response regulator n=1 Tax=Cohnella sp. TaxID=1883426 RepID=UPI0035687B1E
MRGGTTFKAVVVEDETIILENIVKKIEASDAGFEVMAQAFNGRDGCEQLKRFRPDVLVTDIKMPIMDGMELIRQARASYPDMPIIVLSGYDEFNYARQAMRYGVMDYLLKPLDAAVLEETLHRVRDVIVPKNDQVERNWISAGLFGDRRETEIDFLTAHSGYQIFLVGLGHLCNHVTSLNRAPFYAAMWDRIDWQRAVGETAGETASWWLIDEKLSNQKFLIVAADERKAADVKLAAEKLKNRLIEIVKPYPVNISVPKRNAVTGSELWQVAQELRSGLENRTVLGRSSVICDTGELGREDDGANPMTVSVHNQLKALANVGHGEKLKQLLFQQFRLWNEKEFPQRKAEKAIIEIAERIALRDDRTERGESRDLEAGILEAISVAVDFDEVCQAVWGLLESALSAPSNVDDTAELSNKIERYLQMHYAEDISFEELAQSFHFTSAYLTKIFKKHKSETPLKYQIRLRIEEAQRLIAEHRELDLKIIAEMVGYYDQHYFSKVFKNHVGRTPTEFKTAMK